MQLFFFNLNKNNIKICSYKNKFLFRVKNISGLGKKDRHPLNIKGALSAKIVNFCYP